MPTAACPSSEDLAAYASGILPPQQEERVADHLETCTLCEATVQSLERDGDALLRFLRLPAGPDHFAAEPECRLAVESVLSRTVRGNLPPATPSTRLFSGEAIACPGPFHDYDLLSHIGDGGMGAVYKARHRHLKKLAAIKILPARMANDPERLARFRREMRAAGQIDHPQIVRALGAGESEGWHYLAMEFVDGLNLNEVCQRVGKLPIADACEIARRVAVGLKAADEHGLIHRDIKPSNLMLTRDGEVKILDLGLAVFESDQHAGSETTMPGQVVGTAEYIAPEQITDARSVDIRADLYSLGCTLFKFLTGEPPFNDARYPSFMAKTTAHLRDPIPPVRSLRGDVPEKLVAVLNRLVEKDRDLRIPTPGRLADDLRSFCIGADLSGLFARAAQAEHAAQAHSVAPTVAFDVSDSVITSPAPAPARAVPSFDQALAGAPSSLSTAFDPYYKWLGISPKDQPPTHYRLLGIDPFESDREVIHGAVLRQSAHVRTFQLGLQGVLTQKVLNEISAAKVCLLDADKKRLYDAQLRKQIESAKNAAIVAAALAQNPLPRAAKLADLEPAATVKKAASGPEPTVTELTNPEVVEVDALAEAQTLPASSTIHKRGELHKALLADAKSAAATVKSKRDIGHSLAAALATVASMPSRAVKLLTAFRWREISPVQWTAMGASAAGLFIVTMLAISLRTPSGAVTIALSDPTADAQVLVDGIPPPSLAASLQLAAGSHTLEIRAAKFEPVSMTFKVRDGEASTIWVPLEPKGGENPAKVVRVNWPSRFQTVSSEPSAVGDVEVMVLRPLRGSPPDEIKANHSVLIVPVNLKLKEGAAKPIDFPGWADERVRKGVALNDAKDGKGNDYAFLGQVVKADDDTKVISDNRMQVRLIFELPSSIVPRMMYLSLPGAAVHADDETIAYKFYSGDIASNEAPQPAARTDDAPSPQPNRPVPSAVDSPVAGPVPPLAISPFNAAEAETHQAAWAKHLGTPVVKPNSIGMKLVLIPPGEFMMGCGEPVEAMIDYYNNKYGTHTKPTDFNNELPQHRVRISRPYYLGLTHVTRGQFRRFVDDTNYVTDAEKSAPGSIGLDEKSAGPLFQKDLSWRNAGFVQSDEHPVVNVSWNDAQEFCKWLGKKEDAEYRLPSEAEWEYACRAGTTTRYWFGFDPELLAQYANVGDAAAAAHFRGWTTIHSNDGYIYTAPVGQFRANPFGLFDMHGNVWQWCGDWIGPYDAGMALDPTGPVMGTARVIRGGAWYYLPQVARSSARQSSPVWRGALG